MHWLISPNGKVIIFCENAHESTNNLEKEQRLIVRQTDHFDQTAKDGILRDSLTQSGQM